ncbi:hypothetical protein [uncultured Selenomonas sp.]|uniref:hypothetical protein n=1 Tax=uncultured Selenomonas sp. TaxID=159275 RepID=UPI0028DBEC27|nr:hypothetical protein [uncultured Selenomonas sp.]
MGLFWGNDDIKPKQQQQEQQQAAQSKKEDKRLEPLYVLSQGGGAAAGTEFGFLFRDMYAGVRANNNMIADMYDMMKQLIKENEEMRSRLESLEKQAQQNGNPPLERAV